MTTLKQLSNASRFLVFLMISLVNFDNGLSPHFSLRISVMYTEHFTSSLILPAFLHQAKC